MWSSDNFLLDLYACADQPSRWREALDGLCGRTGARSAVVQTFKVQDAQIRMRWAAHDSGTLALRPPVASSVEDERNPRFHATSLTKRLNRIVRDEDIFDADDPRQWQLKAQLEQMGLGRFVGSLKEIAPDTYMALSLHKAADDQQDFSSDQIAQFSTLVPHVGQAAALCERVQKSVSWTERLQKHLDQLRCGLMVVDARGQIQWLNRSAELRMRTPSPLMRHGKQLMSQSADVSARILKHIEMVASSADPRGNWRFLTLQHGAQRVHVALQPMLETEDFAGEHRSVLLVITGGGYDEVIPTAALVSMFGLTPAECLLAEALIRGLTLEQYAAQRGVSVGTVRWHLKQVLSKTGATRQADLMRIVLSSAAAQLAGNVVDGSLPLELGP